MFQWLKSLFGGFVVPKPAGPPHLVQAVGPGTSPIAEAARWEGTELAVLTPVAETVRLFEVPLKGHEQCMLTYRFRIATDALKASVYPEMWCRIYTSGSREWSRHARPGSDGYRRALDKQTVSGGLRSSD